MEAVVFVFVSRLIEAVGVKYVYVFEYGRRVMGISDVVYDILFFGDLEILEVRWG